MDRHLPKPGEKYLHFKGKKYQILCIAEHSKTKEKLVIYQALYGDFTCFARGLAMFMEEVDCSKYPHAQQKYRFELLEEDKVQEVWDEVKETDEVVVDHTEDETLCEATGSGAEIQDEEGEERADPALLQFLDADTLEQKYQVLKMLEGSITNRLIDDFAVALDLVIPEDSLDNRYFQLLSSVRTMQRFENNRFR